MKSPSELVVRARLLKKPMPSTTYIATIPLLAVALGVPIHLAIVRGDYEWFGLIRILGDVSHRPGFWSLCLTVWLFGLPHAPAGHTAFSPPRRLLKIWIVASVASLGLLRLAPTVFRSGYPLDEVACAILTPGLLLHMIATPGSGPQRRTRALRTLQAAALTFLGCTLVVFGHTMFKGMLFLLSKPSDSWLMKVDARLLGSQFYEQLVNWRSVMHPHLTRWLDIVYVGLFEQQWWSFPVLLWLERLPQRPALYPRHVFRLYAGIS